MKRSLQLFIVDYTLHPDCFSRSRYCLAYSHCHAVQVLIRSLVADGYELNSFDVGKPIFIQTYR